LEGCSLTCARGGGGKYVRTRIPPHNIEKREKEFAGELCQIRAEKKTGIKSPWRLIFGEGGYLALGAKGGEMKHACQIGGKKGPNEGRL